MPNINGIEFEVMIATAPDDPAPVAVLNLTFRTRAAALDAARRIRENITRGEVSITLPPGTEVHVRPRSITIPVSGSTIDTGLPELLAAGQSVALYLLTSGGVPVQFTHVPPAELKRLFDAYGR